MKKVLSNLMMFVLALSLVSCGFNNHEGEVKAPGSSGVLKGQNYQEVVQKFETAGFTNISLETIEDLIIGWMTKDGEVESISLGGDENYSADKWYPIDIEVVITYHTFPASESEEQNDILEPEKEEIENVEDVEQTLEKTSEFDEETILTIENCDDLVNLLSIKAEIDDFYSEFAEKYNGQKISFDGCISYMTNHNNNDTRYDLLLSGGDYVDENTQNPGPTFKFEDVNTYNLGVQDLYMPDFISTGRNIRITATVQKFNSDTGLFFLKPVLIEER